MAETEVFVRGAEGYRLELQAKKLFIFDMDGLMFDTEWIYYQAWKRLLAVDGYRLDFEFYKTLIGSPDHTLQDKYFAEFGPEFPFADYLRRYKVESEAFIEQAGVPIKPGLIALLETLARKGVKKAVATSSSRETVEKLLRGAKIHSQFDYILCGDEICKGKPHPEIYSKMLALSGYTAQEAIVLEDSINGIRAANAAGIDCIFVKDIVDPGEAVLALTCAALSGLEEAISMVE